MLSAGKSARCSAIPRIAGNSRLYARNKNQYIDSTICANSSFILARQFHEGTEYGNLLPPKINVRNYTKEELFNRQKNANLVHLVNAYRKYGHLVSDLDPLGIQKAELIEELSAGMYGLKGDSKYDTHGILASSKSSQDRETLSAIIQTLKTVYCKNISYEFEHLSNTAVRRWFVECIETMNLSDLSNRYLRYFELMTKAEVFEHFLQKKLPNVKRYGLEGSESLLVLVDQLIYEGSQAGKRDFSVGFTHRGRGSVLTSLFDYPAAEFFKKLQGWSEFPEDTHYTGDIHVTLNVNGGIKFPYCDQPINVDILRVACHLESAMPILTGKSRTKDINIAMSKNDKNHVIGDYVLPISVHGDSGFTGQGIVAETLSMSGLPHFTNGGTIHVILNNQIGYTTPASHTRTTRYPTDIAKFADIPVIHVNGENPQEVARAARVAFMYREKFRKDIIIDMWTFRRRGHNEMDEPMFTQPAMYRTIASQKSIPAKFEEWIVKNKIATSSYVKEARERFYDKLANEFALSLNVTPQIQPQSPRWRLLGSDKGFMIEKPTGVDTEVLRDIGIKSVTPVVGCKVHSRIDKFHIKPRLKKMNEGEGIDWATAEALAFGSLLKEKYNVRICGQDVGRGTFSQRHAMLVCQETENICVPLNHMGKEQGKLEVVNSNLCEEAVIGFEYGVSIEDPFTLTVWEAQFGDFVNNAQTIIDSYIASGETKWAQQNGLVLLLPHGFDGGGPDHSSCRIERFLLLADEPLDGPSGRVPNMYITNPTTPAQFYHLMRRQVKRNFRRPMIVASAKVLLRLAGAVSSLEDMAEGTRFHPVLDDPNVQNPLAVKRIIFASGKHYYALSKLKNEHQLRQCVAIVRIEELSPFPKNELYQTIQQYANATDFVWAQEEPRNAGAYSFAAPRIAQMLPKHAILRYVGREEHASVCSGVDKQQEKESIELTCNAFEGLHNLIAESIVGRHNGQHQHQKVMEGGGSSKSISGIAGN